LSGHLFSLVSRFPDTESVLFRQPQLARYSDQIGPDKRTLTLYRWAIRSPASDGGGRRFSTGSRAAGSSIFHRFLSFLLKTDSYSTYPELLQLRFGLFSGKRPHFHVDSIKDYEFDS